MPPTDSFLAASHPTPPTEPQLLIAGAGEGSKATITLLPVELAKSGGTLTNIIFADPSEAKVRAGIEEAALRGVAAHGIVCHAEVAVSDEIGAPGPVIVQTDQLPPLIHILTAPEAVSRPVLAFLFVLLPGLLGLRMVFDGESSLARRRAAGLLGIMSQFTRRGSREAIFGEVTRVAHRLAEPLYRRWFAAQIAANLPKLVAGLPSVSEPIEGTFDGRRTFPIVPVFHEGAFWDDPVLLENALDTYPDILPLDEDLILAEVTPNAVRLHVGRVRKTTASAPSGCADRVWDPPITIDRKNLIFVTD